jgi:hypothetical protein
MELLCPNCQKTLTVPDQYAGQLMKCPLCSGTFTTPSLAPTGAPAFMPPPAPPPPPRANDFDVEPVGRGAKSTAAPASPPRVETSAPVTPASMSAPGDYRHRYHLRLSPRVLPWVVVVALVLVFVLTFFAWVGFYPGGVHVISQSGWQAAFGSYSVDPDLEKQSPVGKDAKDRIELGASILLIFFLLLVLLGLLVAAVAAAMGMLTLRVPPWLEQLRPWRWAIASGVLLLAFLFLCLQLLSGFGLPNKMREQAEKEHAAQVKLLVEQTTPNRATATKALEIAQGTVAAFLSRTTALWLVFWLTFIALVCAAATFWLGRRTNLPPPRIDVMW